MLYGKWNWNALSTLTPIRDIDKYSYLPWIMEEIQFNLSITVDYIRNHNYKWNLDIISSNINLSEVESHPDIEWDRDYLSSNKSITVSDILRLKLPNATSEWNWDWIMEEIATIEDVRRYPELPWTKNGLSNITGMTVSDMELLANKPGTWNMYSLSTIVPVSDMLQHIDMGWDREYISMNSTLTIESMSEFDVPTVTGEWTWSLIGEHINMDEIRSHPDLEWNKSDISLNSGITIDDISILSNIKGKWNWKRLSAFFNIADIRSHPNLNWNYAGLSKNKTLDMNYILEHPSEHWDWESISTNIPILNVYLYPSYPWSREGLSNNRDLRITDLISWREVSIPSYYNMMKWKKNVVIV